MKKFKKLLAGLLAGAMMLGSMTTTAFAEEGAGTATATMPTIDTQRTGSLTVHKYEYNYKQTEEKNPGTGSATDNVPSNVKPLSGIKFEITKAYDLTDYYKMDSMKLPTVEEAKTNIANKNFLEVEQTTDNKGIVTFNNLALGIYLVHESDSSAQPQITGKVEDFLVSIPMTNKDGNDWLYDVHVFPKNSSTYASVTLQKKGKIGSADATNLKDATFKIQKKGTDNKWTTITANNKGISLGDAEGKLTTDADGKITVSDLAPGTYRFVETGVPMNTGYIMDGTDTKEFEINNDGKVVINGSTVDTSQMPIEVINYKPNIEKEVKNTDGNWGNDSDYSIGDEVPYRVTVDVPENIDKLVDFTLTDTMLQQAYVPNSLKIYSDSELTNEILVGKYTVNSNIAMWSIAFNSKNNNSITSLLSAYHGTRIYISFKTKLTEEAVTTSVGNPNTVKLEYSNKILPSSNEDGNPNNPGTPGKDEISDQATVYTFKIAVEKVDAENIATKLENVEFDLYRKLADDASSNGVLTNPVKGLTGKYEKVNETSLITDSNGEISKNGLKNGTYYLVETKTNNGYNLLKAPVEVKIAATYTTKTTTTTVTDTSGKTTTTKVVSNERFENVGKNGVFKTVIKNSKGFTLPTTGGMGTVIFSVLGIALVLAGLLVITASRKKAAK